MGSTSQRPISSRRPFSSAIGDLPRAPGRERHGAELLPELLDFEGAVQLAQTLDAAPARIPGPVRPAGEVVAEARARLEATEREARLPLRDPRTGASLLSPERVAQVLARAGVPESRSRKAIAGAARELFAPVEARTLQRIGSLRRVIAELRHELAPIVAASGPGGARLEQIDAALTIGTAVRSDALVAQAIAAIADAFAGDLERAVLALPKPAGELPLGEWASGFVAEHVARCEGLAVAAFLHERARLEALVRNTLGERLA